MSNYTYYPAANSCTGYISFFDDYVKTMRKIIILKNITKKAKKELFDKIISMLDLSGISLDICLCPGTIDEVEAIIIKDISCVIAHYELFKDDIPLYADTVDFSEHLTYDFEVQKSLENINNHILKHKTRMYSHLSEAKQIHDDWEKIYISNMDFDAIDMACEDLLDGIFTSTNLNPHYRIVHRFFGTLLPRGNINYIDELTSDIDRRIFIKGRPGTGKSTLLKRVVAAAENNGYSAEVYYCSFDTKSLDMVIIRELGIALFDSTFPHEIFPTKPADEIFDIYDIAVKRDADELYSDELMHIASKYNQSLKKAKECLYTCHILRQKYDNIISNEDQIEKSINRVISLASLN